jgi:hypothetical protein
MEIKISPTNIFIDVNPLNNEFCSSDCRFYYKTKHHGVICLLFKIKKDIEINGVITKDFTYFQDVWPDMKRCPECLECSKIINQLDLNTKKHLEI